MTSEPSALDRAVAQELAKGGELESQAGTNAVIVHGRKVNHILHLILSVVTAGLWLVVWAVLVLTNKRQRVMLSLDDAGQIQRTVIGGSGPVGRRLCSRCGKIQGAWKDYCHHCQARYAEFPPVAA